MPTTTNLGLPYPAATAAPDVPGDVFALANSLDGLLKTQTWAPTFTDTTTATVGTNGGTDGNYVAFGHRTTAYGRILFGSSASWGTGAAVIANLPVAMDARWSTGTGFYKSGTSVYPIILVPAATGNAMEIRFPASGTSGQPTFAGYAFTFGTAPAQSSELKFTLHLYA